MTCITIINISQQLHTPCTSKIYCECKLALITVERPSQTDTIGEVCYKKVSFIQGFLHAILLHFGTYTNVLYIESALNSGVSF